VTGQKFYCMKTTFFILIIASFQLVAQTAGECYSKVAITDSLSRTASSSISLSKPSSLIITDQYKCACTVKQISLILVRGKRPVFSPILISGNVINSSVLIAKLTAMSILMEAGDVLLVEFPLIINAKGTTCKLSGNTISLKVTE
jgi:hypothetical protein